MATSAEKKVAFLQVYGVVLTGVTAVIGWMALSQKPAAPAPTKFQEITVERINVVDASGTLNMVISNKARQHPGITDGVMSEPREREQGILFFNDKGDEVGGLIFGGDGKKNQYVQMTFDKARNDQTVVLNHIEEPYGTYYSGLSIKDRPNVSLNDTIAKDKEIEKIPDQAKRDALMAQRREAGEFGTNRMFIGRSLSRNSAIIMSDGKGKARLMFMVTEAGEASIKFLDEKGNTTNELKAATVPAASPK
jgi:hypothetical protein